MCCFLSIVPTCATGTFLRQTAFPFPLLSFHPTTTTTTTTSTTTPSFLPFCLSAFRPSLSAAWTDAVTPSATGGERGGVWPARRVLLFRDRHARQMCCCAAPKREFLFRKSGVKKRGKKKERCVIHASSMRSTARQLFSDGDEDREASDHHPMTHDRPWSCE